MKFLLKYILLNTDAVLFLEGKEPIGKWTEIVALDCSYKQLPNITKGDCTIFEQKPIKDCPSTKECECIPPNYEKYTKCNKVGKGLRYTRGLFKCKTNECSREERIAASDCNADKFIEIVNKFRCNPVHFNLDLTNAAKRRAEFIYHYTNMCNTQNINLHGIESSAQERVKKTRYTSEVTPHIAEAAIFKSHDETAAMMKFKKSPGHINGITRPDFFDIGVGRHGDCWVVLVGNKKGCGIVPKCNKTREEIRKAFIETLDDKETCPTKKYEDEKLNPETFFKPCSA